MNKLSAFIFDSGNGLLQGQNKVRILLLGVMAVLLIALAGRFLIGVYDGYAQNIRNEIDIKMTRYDRLSRLMADADKYREEHSALIRFRNHFLEDKLIRASTSTLAEAQLQNMVNNLADQSNLNVLSLRMLPSTQQGDITNLKIGINCRGEIGAVQEFLQRASSHDKFLFVDQLQIQILNQRDRRHYNFNAQLVAWTIS